MSWMQCTGHDLAHGRANLDRGVCVPRHKDVLLQLHATGQGLVAWRARAKDLICMHMYMYCNTRYRSVTMGVNLCTSGYKA